jgi:hypothetical protein
MNEILPFECCSFLVERLTVRVRVARRGKKATLFAVAFDCRSGSTAIATLLAYRGGGAPTTRVKLLRQFNLRHARNDDVDFFS